ncbi:ABC transporter ATP-binding protein [Candidatus Saccharibacteria bacterium]|nr:ABC transporter ATP-binding protein [Candidatus Saccharibacteria bacterium]
MRYYYKLLKKFFSLGATDKHLMRNLFITAGLRTGAYLLVPCAAAMIVDSATDGDYTMALVNTGFFAVSAFLYTLFHHMNYKSYADNAMYIHDELQRKILDKVVTFNQDFTKNISQAEIINTAFEDVTMNQRIPDYFFDLITNFISIVADVIIMIFVDPLIGGITFGLTMCAMAVFIYHMKRRDHYTALHREDQDDIAGLYSQMIDGHKEVHTFNMEENLKDILEDNKKDWKRNFFRKRLHSDLGESLTPFLLGSARVISYFIAAGLILKGEYNIATLVLIIGYFDNMQQSYDGVTDIILNITKSSVAIERVYKLLNYKSPRKQKFGTNDTDDIAGKVQFSNVSFTYGRKPQMRKVSFVLYPGSLTGIVGKSGSGKSTIFRLLLRLYKPTRGKILIDGKNIRDYTKEVYASNVSIVTQKPFVFDMSIRENLNMVDSNHEHQIEACKMVGIHDVIMKLSKGYDTILVSDATNLSAGQKQLLALARTLLSKAEILLFDEVTSTLDASTTKQVIGILKKLKKDHTVLVITHKPEVMRQMDELLVIDNGHLVGRGTHKNLLNNKYYKLLQK